MDSVLNTVKASIGIHPEYTHFDENIKTYANAALLSLHQIGVDTYKGCMIEDEKTEWYDLFPMMPDHVMEAVQTYMSMKVKMMFDPPTSSSLMEATNNVIAELEWRICLEVEKR